MGGILGDAVNGRTSRAVGDMALARAEGTALCDINDLLARGVLGKLQGGGRSTGYLLVK